jgi:hypothetical protein
LSAFQSSLDSGALSSDVLSSNFDFFTGSDPTGGTVDFVNGQEAMSTGLAYVQDDNTTVIGVDAKTQLSVGQNRKSVRISSKKAYDTGLFIADFFAAPHGCGTWPAYWTLGTTAEWPNAGEIDLLEATHNSQTSQVTVHTGPGCSWNTKPKPLASTASSINPAVPFTGSIVGTKCASSDGDNTGCGVKSTANNTFGSLFNKQAGGVIAHRVDSTGIAVWYFARDQIPADITAGNPNPTGWPTPVALFSDDGCDIASHFQKHQLILDITLCGGFGDATYGQEATGSCPGTCAQAVADPTNFKFAQFKIASISVYQ